LTPLKDLFINAVVPLLAGIVLYAAGTYFILPSFIKNHMADALWAYAFISSILVIWGRKISTIWVSVVFITAAVFEWLEYFHFLKGTGDLFDVLVYFISFTTALIINQFIKKYFYQNSTQHAFN
jgi:hypothetical protein